MFSYALTWYRSNKVAAIALVLGTMLDIASTCVLPHAVPMLNIHSISDSAISYNGNSAYNSIQAVLDYWIEFNKTSTITVENNAIDNGTTIEYYQYTEGINNVSVEHYKVIDGHIHDLTLAIKIPIQIH